MPFDTSSARTLIARALPARSRWNIAGTIVDWNFEPERFPFIAATDIGITGAPADASGELLVFGCYDIAEGGAAAPYVAIHRLEGSVYSLDVEHESPLSPFNSSLAAFVETFALLDGFLGRKQKLPEDIFARAEAIDSAAFAASEWRLLLEAI